MINGIFRWKNCQPGTLPYTLLRLLSLRKQMVKEIVDAGFEVRTIVTEKLDKNEVMKYFDYTVYDELKNSN